MSIKFIPPEGSLEAKIVFIGEAPGEEEDKQGRPFVGRSGKILDKYIEFMGLTREQTYITNIVKVRPEKNRTPTNDELESWKLLLLEELDKLDPKVIVPLGACASKIFAGYDKTMKELRQYNQSKPWKFFNAGKNINIVYTYHPAYCLRNPNSKEEVKKDLKIAKEILNG